MTRLGLGHPCAFMGTSAQGSAFDRRAVRVHWIDFNNPTKTIRFVRVQLGIETCIVGFPLAVAFAAQAPAFVVR